MAKILSFPSGQPLEPPNADDGTMSQSERAAWVSLFRAMGSKPAPAPKKARKPRFSLQSVSIIKKLGLNKYGQEVQQPFDPSGTTPEGPPVVPATGGGYKPHLGRIYTAEEYYHPDFDPDAEDDEE